MQPRAMKNDESVLLQNGEMPAVNPAGKLVVSSRSRGKSFRVGAGRVEWGEGIRHKPSKEAKKRLASQKFVVSERRKKSKKQASMEVEDSSDSDSD